MTSDATDNPGANAAFGDAPILSAGRALYDALGSGDRATLEQLLAEDFQGELTAGLPNGAGGRYDGRAAMMEKGWGAIGEVFSMAPKVDRTWDGGDVLIARGFYMGHAVQTGRPVKAAFAHFWTFDGTRFTGVTQVTDSAIWANALQSA